MLTNGFRSKFGLEVVACACRQKQPNTSLVLKTFDVLLKREKNHRVVFITAIRLCHLEKQAVVGKMSLCKHVQNLFKIPQSASSWGVVFFEVCRVPSFLSSIGLARKKEDAPFHASLDGSHSLRGQSSLPPCSWHDGVSPKGSRRGVPTCTPRAHSSLPFRLPRSKPCTPTTALLWAVVSALWPELCVPGAHSARPPVAAALPVQERMNAIVLCFWRVGMPLSILPGWVL